MQLDGYPSAQAFNQAIEQVAVELSDLYQRADALRAKLVQLAGASDLAHWHTELQVRSLEEQISRLTREAEEREAIVFCETFTGTENYDLDRVRGTAAEVAADQGALCLARDDGREFQGRAVVRIVGGNGFPGNTHQVLADGRTFAGQNGAHTFLGAITDGNADTWFDYELFEPVSLPMPFVAYKEGCSWLQRNTGGLRLEIELELEKPEIVNWVTLNPYIPADRGTAAANLEWLVLDDEHGMRQGIPGGKLNREKVFWASPQETARVRLSLAQSIPYLTEAGILATSPSVRHLGLVHDASGNILIQPSFAPGQEPISEDNIAAAYFGSPARVLPVRRYHIGLRDVQVAGYRFAPVSTYISKPFSVDEGIASLALKPEVFLPPGNAGHEWVNFSVTIDDGRTWLPVALPWDMAGVREYVFGHYPPSALRKPGAVYLGGTRPESVRVKIELSRPLNAPLAPYLGPLVHGYLLTVRTGDMTHDY